MKYGTNLSQNLDDVYHSTDIPREKKKRKLAVLHQRFEPMTGATRAESHVAQRIDKTNQGDRNKTHDIIHDKEP